MITQIDLENFKCFTRAEAKLGQLNVFAGSNGTGKSTIIQALLLMFQSVQSNQLRRKRLQLNGSLTELGTGRDVLYRRSEVDQFQITIKDNESVRTISALVPTSIAQHTLDAILEPEHFDITCLQGKIFYLSADRLGPQKFYPMNLDDSFGNEIGKKGEFAPLLFHSNRATHVENEILFLETPEKQRFTDVDTQFNLWMRRLFPGFQARADSVEQTDSVLLGLNLQQQIGEPEYFRPTNVGFGVTVAFPIILAGLLAKRGTTFLVENPEAHLHPSAQSMIGEFLARVAAGGVQVFIETHSDHVVNGIRIASKNAVIAAEDIKFFAFMKTDEYGSHRIETVALDSNGEFVTRPDMFFDQADKDLKLLYGLE